MKKPELLAPVGNLECLEAAIQAGCDAVYLGGKLFGARAFSINFNNEEMIQAINYAHLYGVKVYVTVNTIIYESEVERFMEYIDFLVKNNVDALIMQDLGMIDLVRKTYPNLEIHGSTQMHIHNLSGVKMAEKMGLKRVVLARETDLETLNEIRKNTSLELEIFIHGALCVSYSGQCLMSSLIGNRSGNRGTCAQCCRMNYDLLSNGKILNKDKYILSTKDLCTINSIDKLIDMKIDSLKIEGRMKRKEYVYLVVSLYRKAIDSYCEYGKINIDQEDIKKLKVMFNREFTKGFLFNEDNTKFTNPKRPNHMGLKIGKVISAKNNMIKIKLSDILNQGDGIRILGHDDVGCTVNKIIKNGKLVNKAFNGDEVELNISEYVCLNSDVLKTTDKKLIDEIDILIEKKSRKVKINGNLICKIGNRLELHITDGINNVIVYGKNVEASINSPTSYERIKEQLNKLGDTVYKFNELDINGDKNIFTNIKELNDLRREAINMLNDKRCYSKEYIKASYSIQFDEVNEEKGLCALVHNIDEYNKLNKDYKYIYIDNEELFNNIDDNRKILKLSRVRNDNNIYDNSLVGELGSLLGNNNYSDFSFNVVNSYAVAYLHSIGIKRVTLSYELNDKQIENIVNEFIKRYNKKPNLELIVSSYPESMISKFNLYKLYKENELYIKDKFNNLFKVKDCDKYMIIKHYEKIVLDDYQKYFDMGINTLRIDMGE